MTEREKWAVIFEEAAAMLDAPESVPEAVRRNYAERLRTAALRAPASEGEAVEVRIGEEEDEIVTHGVIHVERMSDRHIWANLGGVSFDFVVVKGKLVWRVQEVEWADLARAYADIAGHPLRPAPPATVTEAGPWLTKAADRLAGEVLKLTESGTLGTRSPAADALLDYATTRHGQSDPIGSVRAALAASGAR